MNFINLIADLATPYSPHNTESNMVEAIGIIVIGSALVVGVVALTAFLLAKITKRNNINNNAQGLYGPPSMFNKKEVDPPEDLYGCPRPDGIDEEPYEKDVQEDEKN